jgi:hypothetical protein
VSYWPVVGVWGGKWGGEMRGWTTNEAFPDHEHISHWSKRAMQSLMDQVGLKIVKRGAPVWLHSNPHVSVLAVKD